jgi:hypothetical protein
LCGVGLVEGTGVRGDRCQIIKTKAERKGFEPSVN